MKIYQHSPFKGPPKFTQIGIFWFENKPSGNPAQEQCDHIERNLAVWGENCSRLPHLNKKKVLLPCFIESGRFCKFCKCDKVKTNDGGGVICNLLTYRLTS
jgi:hypothetical protein